MKRRLGNAAFLLLACLACAGCATAPAQSRVAQASGTPDDLRSLLVMESFLAGYWTNTEQAATDKSYPLIRLRLVPVWTERADEHWLYEEQALAGREDAPFHQRVYRLTSRKGEVLMLVYVLPGDPARFAADWKKARPLEGLRPENLLARPGCTIVMQRQMDLFFNGGTQGKECANGPDGAYATFEISLTSATMKKLDRGFDADGKQVSGPTKGAYDFSKVSRGIR
jgi:hypothetical protein